MHVEPESQAGEMNGSREQGEDRGRDRALIKEEKVMVVSVLLRTTNKKDAGTDARFELQGGGVCDKDVKKYGDISWSRSGSGNLMKFIWSLDNEYWDVEIAGEDNLSSIIEGVMYITQ
jgi:hypothetical protein